ncbi:dUTP diphosphatase [Marispirochaeta sp.]|jgi:dUTP pyrophosphatase|uniref:dUTP diphosphatase n=1 Tax=Marispirochaeta sp. TaxID=2038653 RepID=UPI0029C7AE19|nr:dUTP diphosphatase [Marispirochaeta sp.]
MGSLGTIRVPALLPASGAPKYATKVSSGADLLADITEELVLQSLERAIVPTGLFLAIPPGFEAQVRPRSGLALRRGLTVLNSPGTIDADYRGEIKVILVNLSARDVTVLPGERIAQIIFAPVIQALFEEHDELPSTERGSGGFGSTGV